MVSNEKEYAGPSLVIVRSYTRKLGAKGDEVRQIQEKLIALGICKEPIVGAFGGGTETAVRKYQRTEQQLSAL